MPTNKTIPKRAKRRRHASPVTSSQNSCTGELNPQQVLCGRHSSLVKSSQNSHIRETNPQKLAVMPVRPAKMASSSQSSSSDDIALLATLLFFSIHRLKLATQLLDTSFSEEDTSSSKEGEGQIVQQRPQRTFPLSGQEYTALLLNGHPDTMKNTLRVDAHTFRTLVKLMVKGGGLKWDHMRLSVEESLAIFLYICGHAKTRRCAANQFRHSVNTIARHFKYMGRALWNLARFLIQPPDLNEIPFEILHDKVYYPWFENCVGAIGGICIEGGSEYAQKMMAVCSFDEKFTFVYAGWERWATDAQILAAAFKPECRFPHPPANKYYLVDFGYTNMPGYLAPYHGKHHQKDDLNGVNRAYPSPMDLFNHKHSSLRNVTERCFGALKARFCILKAMPKYNPECLPMIMVACCAVHNLILIQGGRDEFFKQIEEEIGHGNVHNHVNMSIDMSCEAMANTRKEIADAMWEHWEAYANGN